MTPAINDDAKRRDFARDEAKYEIYWGSDLEVVVERLRTNYGIEGDAADSIIEAAVSARRSAVRRKASVALLFAAIGLAVPVTYFAIQEFVGFVLIGFAPLFMALLGLACVAMAGRSLYRILTGDASGPV